MLRIVTGNPGSGKTYYALKYLMKFCNYDKLYNVINVNDEVLLITNIEDIKLKHMTVDQFFDYELYLIDNMKEYLVKYRYKRVIFIADEAQRYFSSIKNDKIYFFFEYHRHLGIDAFIICQNLYQLPKRLVSLAEYVVDAMPRMYSITKNFRYANKDSVTGSVVFVSSLMIDKQVFKLYKSFEFDEMEKPKPVVLRKLLVGVLAFAITLGGAYYWVIKGNLFYQHKDKMVKKVENEGPKPVNVMQSKIEIKDKKQKVQKQDHVDKKEREDIKTIPMYVKIPVENAPDDYVPNNICAGTLRTENYVYYIMR